MADYLALIRVAGSGYTVRFPDFPTIVAHGDTLDEARHAAREALAAQIGFMLDEGLPIPDPGSIETVLQDRRNRDAIAMFLPAPLMGKTVRVAAALDERLVQEIDSLAAAKGLGRSGFIGEALRQYIATVRQADKIHAEVKAMKRARQRGKN